MTDFRGDWYSLRTISTWRSPCRAATTDQCHGASEPQNAALLVAFPERGVVVAVQVSALAMSKLTRHAILMDALVT